MGEGEEDKAGRKLLGDKRGTGKMKEVDFGRCLSALFLTVCPVAPAWRANTACGATILLLLCCDYAGTAE